MCCAHGFGVCAARRLRAATWFGDGVCVHGGCTRQGLLFGRELTACTPAHGDTPGGSSVITKLTRNEATPTMKTHVSKISRRVPMRKICTHSIQNMPLVHRPTTACTHAAPCHATRARAVQHWARAHSGQSGFARFAARAKGPCSKAGKIKKIRRPRLGPCLGALASRATSQALL